MFKLITTNLHLINSNIKFIVFWDKNHFIYLWLTPVSFIMSLIEIPDRKDQLREVAQTLFKEKGYAGSSMRDKRLKKK